MKLKYFLFIFFCSLFSLTWGNNETLLEQANEAYKNEDFTNAHKLYTQIETAGDVSWSLYYNLGNTYYRLSDMPRAILYYEKALKLNPNEKTIVDNLAIAKNYIEDKSSTYSASGVLSFLNSIVYAFSSNTWAIFSLLFFFLMAFFFIATFILSARSVKKAFLIFSLFSLFFAIIGLSLSWTQKNELNKPTAIIMEQSVTITSEPKENSTNLFILHAGSKVEIKETAEEWIRIQYDEKKSGWMKASFLEKI